MNTKPKTRPLSKTFLSKEPKARMNSEMIRRLLYDTIAEEFGYDLDQASNQLFATVSASLDRRGYDSLISPHGLRKATLDKHYITYIELNALAKHYRIPISVMLLFTRIRDELETAEKRRSGDALRILASMRAVCLHLENIARDLTSRETDIMHDLGHAAFREFVAVYENRMSQLVDEPELPID